MMNEPSDWKIILHLLHEQSLNAPLTSAVCGAVIDNIRRSPSA
jgi:hypothetical protein